MKCLQCDKSAVEKNETYKGIKIRECESGHRTGIMNGAQLMKRVYHQSVKRRNGIYKLPKVA